MLPLGYDVAGICGACWSIVGDFSESEWAKPYLPLLNENGLFRDRADAERYRNEYQENNDPDYDFEVVFVSRILPKNKQ